MLKRKLNWRGFVTVFVFSPIVLLVSWVFYLVGTFYWHLDEYSNFVFRKDIVMAKKKLEQLNYFYDWSERLKLDFLTNRLLLKNTAYYREAFNYLTGRYELININLASDDDFWACYLRGNANWRKAQDIYRFSLTRKDEAEKSKITKRLKIILENIRQDYERAVRKDPEYRWSPKWNYDLVVIVKKGLEKDASEFEKMMARRALGPKPKKIKLKLGIDRSGKDGENEKDGKPSSSPGGEPEIRG